MYIGYEITEESRAIILNKFIPRHSKVICHHITERFGVTKDTPAPDVPASILIVGYKTNDFIEALVVSINGSVHRPDGKYYHITLSLDPRVAKPVMSNDLIRDGVWEKIQSFPIDAIPKNFYK